MARLFNDLLRFTLELTALVAFAMGGSGLASGAFRYGTATAAVLLGAAYWGVLIAPKSKRRLREPARLGAEVLFFVAAGLAAWASGRPLFAAVLFPLAVANAIVLRALGTAAP